MLQEPLVCNILEPQMHTPTRMDKVVIRDYYHMTTMDEYVNWMELTHFLSVLSLALLDLGKQCGRD